MDLLLGSKAVGPQGRAIGIDMTESMMEKAMVAARTAGLANIEMRLGDAMSLPLDNESVDVVISNGVLNLVPDKSVAYSEVLRLLKPGGRFLYSDIIVASELSESIRRNIDL
jgi:arsenite methyltransferase